MRVPLSWLAEHCDPGMEARALAERLSMTGTEVERIDRHGAPAPDHFVVGRVRAVSPHPDADRLRVCEVEVGEPEIRTIVCGAPNVAPEQTVAVALPGAVLADGTELGEVELRGVRSAGMILSEPELAIGDDAEGIAVLDGGAQPGAPLASLLVISDWVLELEVTPNRPDCLGLYGVAREVHAVTAAPLGPEPWAEDAVASGEREASDHATVSVEVPELCPRFTARVFTELTVGPSPAWLKARLTAAGQRPINNVVDITNYVMLLTGQPLHAFDLDVIAGGALRVRRAAEGERMTTLDDVERTFTADAVLVCDAEGPSGIAGIMGGRRSEVSAGTTRVLLEVASWDGTNILATSSALGVRSEASTRFEKQLHPALTMRAQRLASRLIVELCDARMAPGTIDVANADSGRPAPELALRPARIEALLGMPVEPGVASRNLERLGFAVESGDEELRVRVPPDRHYDVTREADLIEEVARVHGLDEHLPTTLPGEAAACRGELSEGQRLRRRAEDLLRGVGFDEIVSWSFTAPETADRLLLFEGDPRRSALRVHNPLSSEDSAMRTTLLSSLLDAARHNIVRGSTRLRLFESGRVYLPQPAAQNGPPEAGRFVGATPAPASEPQVIGALLVGPLAPPVWTQPSSAPERDAGADRIYELKGVLEALCDGVRAGLEVEPTEGEPFLHPGRGARVLLAGEPAGWIGQLHPLVARAWDVPVDAAAFELAVAALLAAAGAGSERYEDVTSHPAVYEDIAIVVPAEVSAAEITEAVAAAGGELLRDAQIFDVYAGEQVGEGRRSLALRLEFSASDRTLTDVEVAERREQIVAAIEAAGGALRG